MKLLSALLVGYMIFDFAPKPAAPEEPKSVEAYMETGTGELSATIEMVEVGSIARGATRVRLATLNLSASCEADIAVEGVDLLHTGLGDPADIQGVYVTNGIRRVSRARRFDVSGRAGLRMTGVVIPQCSAIRLPILADFSLEAAAGGEHGVTIEGALAFRSSAKKTHYLGLDVTRQVVTSPYRTGKISVNFLPLKKRFSYGRIETVARIQLTADSGGSHFLKEITLTNTESARDMNLINFRLETRSGEVLSGVATRMHGRTVRIPFDPSYLLSRNQTVVLLLKAEIRGSQGRKVNFTLEEPGDLIANPARER